MPTKSHLFIIAFSLIVKLPAQFLDAVVPLEFDNARELKKINSEYLLTGNSLQLPSDILIDGAAIRFSASQNTSIWIQFLELNGNWTKKRKAKIFYEPNSDRFIASILDSTLSKILKIKYEAKSSSRITFVSAGVYNRTDKDIKVNNEKIDSLPAKLGVDKPVIISRKEWDARNPKYDYSNHPYFDKMTLHHAAGWAAKTLDEGKAAVKSIQEFHQDGRGWSDIGYHFLVDMAGNIYQGRPETVLGAHVGGANTGNIGVCLLGCYHPPETSIPCYDEMSYNSEKSLIKLYAWISDKYGVKPKLLKGHRDYFGTTSCPGNNVWSLIPQLRAEISLFVQYGFQPTRFALFQNYPNPFNTSTTLHYDLPEPSKVSITIYDILGNEVIRLIDADQHYGYKKIVWNGENANGNLVSPGVYFFKAQLGSLIETKKMTLVK